MTVLDTVLLTDRETFVIVFRKPHTANRFTFYELSRKKKCGRGHSVQQYQEV